MRRNPRQFTLAAIPVVCVLLLAACNCAPTLRYITISPTSATTAVGGTVQFSASAYYSDGTITSATGLVLWTSSAPAVATVNSSGLVTGVSLGTATISASAAGTSGATASVTVDQLQSIAVTPANSTVPVGETQQYDAMGTFLTPGGTTTTMDVTTIATWAATGNTNVSIGASTGLATVATTATVGSTATISAALYGITGTTTMTVGSAAAVSLSVTPASPTIAIGNALALVATENWSDGTTGHTPAGPVTWASGTTTTANVVSSLTNGTGVVSGIAAGTSTITATEGTLTPGTSALTVVTGSAQYAYIANDDAGNIGSYTANATTSPYLTALSTFTTPLAPLQTVINPTGLYMYYTDGNSNIYTAAINPTTGALSTPSGMTPLVAGSGGTNFTVVDPYGRFVYVIDDGSGTTPAGIGSIYGFTVNQTTGLLTAIGSVTNFSTNVENPQCVIIDRTGSYLYVTNYVYVAAPVNPIPPNISQYSINPTTGALTPLSPAYVALTTQPLLETLDPAGAHLYTANSNNRFANQTTPVNSISSFSIGTTGTLTSLGADVTISGATKTFNLTVDPSDSHIYVVDSGPTSGNGQVFGYAVGSGGVIGSAITGTPIATGPGPLGSIVIDPTGSLMAVDNSIAASSSTTSSISLYTIGTGANAGQLTSQTAVATGLAPSYYVVFYNVP
jgi:hypothetical protein